MRYIINFCKSLSLLFSTAFFMCVTWAMISMLVISTLSGILGYDLFIAKNWVFYLTTIILYSFSGYLGWVIGDRMWGIIRTRKKIKKLETELWTRIFTRPKNWRIGQAAFNYAYDSFPECADVLRGSEFDPFFTDTVEEADDFIKKFMEIVYDAELGKC